MYLVCTVDTPRCVVLDPDLFETNEIPYSWRHGFGYTPGGVHGSSLDITYINIYLCNRSLLDVNGEK